MVHWRCCIPILGCAFFVTAAASPRELTGQIVTGAYIVELVESHVHDDILTIPLSTNSCRTPSPSTTHSISMRVV